MVALQRYAIGRGQREKRGVLAEESGEKAPKKILLGVLLLHVSQKNTNFAAQN